MVAGVQRISDLMSLRGIRQEDKEQKSKPFACTAAVYARTRVCLRVRAWVRLCVHVYVSKNNTLYMIFFSIMILG